MLTIYQNQVSTTDQRLLYKSFENTVGKGEIAHNEIAHNVNTVEKGEIARN